MFADRSLADVGTSRDLRRADGGRRPRYRIVGVFAGVAGYACEQCRRRSVSLARDETNVAIPATAAKAGRSVTADQSARGKRARGGPDSGDRAWAHTKECA